MPRHAAVPTPAIERDTVVACLDVARYALHAVQRTLVLLEERGIDIQQDHPLREILRNLHDGRDRCVEAVRQTR